MEEEYSPSHNDIYSPPLFEPVEKPTLFVDRFFASTQDPVENIVVDDDDTGQLGTSDDIDGDDPSWILRQLDTSDDDDDVNRLRQPETSDQKPILAPNPILAHKLPEVPVNPKYIDPNILEENEITIGEKDPRWEFAPILCKIST